MTWRFPSLLIVGLSAGVAAAQGLPSAPGTFGATPGTTLGPGSGSSVMPPPAPIQGDFESTMRTPGIGSPTPGLGLPTTPGPTTPGTIPEAVGGVPITNVRPTQPVGREARVPPIPSTTGTVPSTTEAIPSTTGTLPPTTGTVPSTTEGLSTTPSTTGTIPSTTGTIPSTTGTIPSTTGTIPSTTPIVPSTTGTVPSTTGTGPRP